MAKTEPTFSSRRNRSNKRRGLEKLNEGEVFIGDSKKKTTYLAVIEKSKHLDSLWRERWAKIAIKQAEQRGIAIGEKKEKDGIVGMLHKKAKEDGWTTTISEVIELIKNR